MIQRCPAHRLAGVAMSPEQPNPVLPPPKEFQPAPWESEAKPTISVAPPKPVKKSDPHGTLRFHLGVYRTVLTIATFVGVVAGAALAIRAFEGVETNYFELATGIGLGLAAWLGYVTGLIFIGLAHALIQIEENTREN